MLDVARQDHPRRCGENAAILADLPSLQGSPPQVRGKPLLPQNGHGLSRITPAGAGKTQYRPKQAPIVQDHPRRCGENSPMFSSTNHNRGSPPQVRGKPRELEVNFVRCQDHPRRCGENPDGGAVKCLNIGSPPQVRGKLVGSVFNDGVYRITPAGAGKTLRITIICSDVKDHPRRCGENN